MVLDGGGFAEEGEGREPVDSILLERLPRVLGLSDQPLSSEPPTNFVEHGFKRSRQVPSVSPCLFGHCLVLPSRARPGDSPTSVASITSLKSFASPILVFYPARPVHFVRFVHSPNSQRSGCTLDDEPSDCRPNRSGGRNLWMAADCRALAASVIQCPSKR